MIETKVVPNYILLNYTVNCTSDYTLWTLYHFYLKCANIELQLNSVTCC
jgi:hypothetical protein